MKSLIILITLATFVTVGSVLFYINQESHTASSFDQYFPPNVSAKLKSLTGLDSEQWHNTMQLISKAEQDDITWNRSKYYGYCSRLSYDAPIRGFTLGIYGATTGGSEPGDSNSLFNAYGTKKESLGYPDKTKFCSKISELGSDQKWQAANWDGFLSEYINWSYAQLKKLGYTSALSIAAVVDTSLNQGKDMDKGTAWVFSKIGTKFTSEKDFLTKFLDKRETVAGTSEFNDPPINGKNRVNQYRQLMNAGAWTLKNCNTLIKNVTSWNMK